MPNWFYICINGLYLSGLAIWFGGGVLMTVLSGPELFRAYPQHEASLLSAAMLHRFAKLRVVALLLMIAGAGVKFLIWERNELAPWMAVRWGAIVLMAWALVVELRRHRLLHVLGSTFPAALPSDDPLRALFDVHRIGVEGLMRASLLAAFIALLFS